MNDEHQKRLQWACRRGMLELDMLLEPFLLHAYPDLSQKEKAIFQRLLEENDQDLFQWFLGSTSPDDDELKLMVETIRTHAATQLSN